MLTDTELFNLCSQNDEKAFKVFYNRHWSILYKIVYRKIHRSDIAEELTQELFIKVWENRHTTQISNMAAYLNTAIRNLIISYARKQLQESKYLQNLSYKIHTTTLESNSTLEQVEYELLNQKLEDALIKLPEKTRNIFLWHRFNDLNVNQIAQRLKLTKKCIEYHLTRSHFFLRKSLNDYI